MSSNSWSQVLTTAQLAGATLTAASAASMIPAAARFTLPANVLQIGTTITVKAAGSLSCAATTPGTARFDLRLGTSVVFDSQAITLATAGFTNVPWWMEVLMTCRSIGNGTTATILGMGEWVCPAATSGNVALPFAGSIGVGAGFDSTVSNTVDSFFTQTVATGSLTLQLFKMTLDN